MKSIRPPGRSPEAVALRESLLVAAVLVVALAALLVHIRFYAFLTDDAFISFRYARNLAHGHGLVFNPGFERVEGYTNFLWVVILAAFARLGAAPENVAGALSVGLSVVMLGAVAWFGLRFPTGGRRWVAIALPPLLLAATRSFAVWGTSGLETRLFELLVLAAALRLLVEAERLETNGAGTWPAAALLFGLATLTRPDGALITACAFAALGVTARRRLALHWRWLAASAGVYVGLVGSHLVFRLAYYGAWLPNTYYAKVGDQLRWETGLRYLAAFALEYAIYLWVPLLVAGIVACWRSRRPLVPLLFLGICLPHAAYVAAVGGDHFEYRPLDLYPTFAYLLMGAGAAWWSRGRWQAALVAAWSVVVFAGIVDLPYQSHRQFPRTYITGYPGTKSSPERAAYLEPSRGGLHRLPGLRALAARHRDLQWALSERFVGLRQEEHRLFLLSVLVEGVRLRDLVAEGRIPADTHIAICCVGAIPYYSGLRTLDRHGLTDAVVAHGDSRGRILAHGKFATLDYAAEREVDLWSVDTVHLVFPGSHPSFLRELLKAHRRGIDAYFADLGGGQYLLAVPPLGADHLRHRFPSLAFTSTRDGDAVVDLARSLGADVRYEPHPAQGQPSGGPRPPAAR